MSWVECVHCCGNGYEEVLDKKGELVYKICHHCRGGGGVYGFATTNICKGCGRVCKADEKCCGICRMLSTIDKPGGDEIKAKSPT